MVACTVSRTLSCFMPPLAVSSAANLSPIASTSGMVASRCTYFIRRACSRIREDVQVGEALPMREMRHRERVALREGDLLRAGGIALGDVNRVGTHIGNDVSLPLVRGLARRDDIHLEMLDGLVDWQAASAKTTIVIVFMLPSSHEWEAPAILAGQFTHVPHRRDVRLVVKRMGTNVEREALPSAPIR